MALDRAERGAAEAARSRAGVLSAAELAQLGLDRHAVRRRVARGVLWPIHRGVFAFGSPELSRDGSMRAAALSCGSAALIGRAAAVELWDLADVRAIPIDVMVARGQPRRPELRVHRTRWLPPEHVAVWRGIPVTSPARTLLDAGLVLGDGQYELAVATALRRRLVDPAELHELASGGRPGAPALRSQLDRVGGPQFTRSRAERMLLALVRRAGLPPPTTNFEVLGVERDLVWPRQRVVVEFDGFAFHWSPRTKAGDSRRDSEVRAAGWQPLRFTWREISDCEHVVVAQLAAALAAGSVRDNA